MTQYAGNPVFPIDFTIADDASPPTAAVTNIGLEALGDRTAYLKVQTDAITPLASIAVLTAIAAPTNGLVRHVVGSGFFVFETATTTGSAPFYYAADDATVGRWASSTARRRSLVGIVDAALATTVVQSATAYTDVPGLSITLACEAGDVVAIDASIFTLCLGVHAVRVMLDDGGSVDPAQAAHYDSTVDDGAIVSRRSAVRSFHYVVANAGNLLIKVQAKYTAASGVTAVDIMGLSSTDGAASTLRAMQWRV